MVRWFNTFQDLSDDPFLTRVSVSIPLLIVVDVVVVATDTVNGVCVLIFFFAPIRCHTHHLSHLLMRHTLKVYICISDEPHPDIAMFVYVCSQFNIHLIHCHFYYYDYIIDDNNISLPIWDAEGSCVIISCVPFGHRSGWNGKWITFRRIALTDLGSICILHSIDCGRFPDVILYTSYEFLWEWECTFTSDQIVFIPKKKCSGRQQILPAPSSSASDEWITSTTYFHIKYGDNRRAYQHSLRSVCVIYSNIIIIA